MMKSHVFVMIRYSVLTQDNRAWKIGRSESFEDYKKNLFSDERLSLHLELFEGITLPSLLEMDKSKTTVLVFVSDEMPDIHLDRLSELLGGHEWIKIKKVSVAVNLVKSMNFSLLEELKRFDSSLCYATVRLDDDDSLSNNYFKKLKRYVSPSYRGHVVSFPFGFYGIYNNRRFESFHKIKLNKVALGLAYIDFYARGSERCVSIYDLGDHTKVDNKYPLIVDGTFYSFIRTVHPESDSYGEALLKKAKNSEIVEKKEVLKIFRF